jgi:coiled-coil domain-containing protein 55
MDKLLASAEVRKRDYLIAQEKKYKKEREQEGEEFAGKEKFVTNAYKRQQEEIRKAEEEERQREGTPNIFRTLLTN